MLQDVLNACLIMTHSQFVLPMIWFGCRANCFICNKVVIVRTCSLSTWITGCTSSVKVILNGNVLTFVFWRLLRCDIALSDVRLICLVFVLIALLCDDVVFRMLLLAVGCSERFYGCFVLVITPSISALPVVFVWLSLCFVSVSRWVSGEGWLSLKNRINTRPSAPESQTDPFCVCSIVSVHLPRYWCCCSNNREVIKWILLKLRP